MKNKSKYNLAVIGGGPAGMMAAIFAAQNKAKVVIIEKNPLLGIKLASTGKGRCNITNAESDMKKFIEIYGKNGRFLYSAFTQFSNQDTIDFFESKGVQTKVERGQRVFPLSDNSKSVVDCLKENIEKNNIDIRLNSPVKKIISKSNHIEKIILENNREVVAANYLIATGGKSYPGTGSTGEAYYWLEKMGHTITSPKPGLSPIIVKQKTLVKKLEGLSLKNVEISLWQSKKLASYFGEAIFTANGISGPIVLNMSKKIHEIDSKDIKIKINFKPALDHQTLDKRILRDFSESGNKQFKNCLGKLLPKKLIPVIIELSHIPPDKKVNEIKKEERRKLIKLLQEFELSYNKLLGFQKAIVTIGGVNLKEIDPKTMKSKIIDNLYLAGEILDLDGPTGGYNLQVAWSTGYLAGINTTN